MHLTLPVIPPRNATFVEVPCPAGTYDFVAETFRTLRDAPGSTFSKRQAQALLRDVDDAEATRDAFTFHKGWRSRAAAALELIEDYPSTLSELVGGLLPLPEGRLLLFRELNPQSVDALDESVRRRLLAELSQHEESEEFARRLLSATNEPVLVTALLASPTLSKLTTLEVATTLVQSPEGDCIPMKAEQLQILLGKAADREAALSALLEMLLKGSIPSKDMQQTAKGLVRDLSASKEWLTSQIAKESGVVSRESVLVALGSGELDPIDYLEMNRQGLAPCESSIPDLEACIGALRHLPSRHLRLDTDFATRLGQRIASVGYRAELPQLARQLADSGVDLQAVAQEICNRLMARSSWERDDSEATLLSVLSIIGDGTDCVSVIRRGHLQRLLTSIGQIAACCAVALLPTLLLARRLRRKLPGIQARLRSASTTDWSLGARGRLAEKVWEHSFSRALAATQVELARASDSASREAADALRALDDSQRGRLVSAVRALAMSALHEGDLQSMALEAAGQRFYVLVFPTNQHDPQALARHAAFAGGWSDHVLRLQDLLRAHGRPSMPLLALLVFLHPDASTGGVISAYESGENSLLPGPLVADREAASRPSSHVQPLVFESS